MGKIVFWLYFVAAIVLVKEGGGGLHEWIHQTILDIDAREVAFYKLKADVQRAQIAADELVEAIDRERANRSRP